MSTSDYRMKIENDGHVHVQFEDRVFSTKQVEDLQTELEQARAERDRARATAVALEQDAAAAEVARVAWAKTAQEQLAEARRDQAAACNTSMDADEALIDARAALTRVRAVLDAPPDTGTTATGTQAARDALAADIRRAIEPEETETP